MAHAKRSVLIVAVLAFLLGGVLTYYLEHSQWIDKILNRALRVSEGEPRFVWGSDLQLSYTIPEYLEEPDFLGVRSPRHPIWAVCRGLDVEKVATGFTLPVNIAFANREQDEGAVSDSPFFYVTELHGTIKYVALNGSVHTYARGLTNHEHRDFYASDETGLIGLACLPDSEDLVITTAHVDKESGLLSNRIVRLVSDEGGKTMKEAKVLLEFNEFTSPSHQIQQVAVGPDGKLYVSVGDAHNFATSLNLERFAGKLLRMNPDGTPCQDNPFFDAHAPTTPSHYVYAFGLRNMFDLDYHPASQRFYGADNGPLTDRFIQLLRGGGYGWDGSDGSMRVNALFTWGPDKNPGPAGLVILKRPTLGKDTYGRCYVGMASNPVARHGQAIWECMLAGSTGTLAPAPERVLQYVGSAKTTVVGLSEGPDGVYFTDFFGETEGTGNEDQQGNIWRLFPTDSTLHLPGIASAASELQGPVANGYTLFRFHCAGCHRLDGTGGAVGPNLSRVARDLEIRLTANGYLAEVRSLLRAAKSFSKLQRPRLKQVLDEPVPRKRVRVWLEHHLQEPRFDNPFARMPSFSEALTETQMNDVIEFLMTRN